MKTLILGGTGAMGVPLVKLLKKESMDIYVTTRSIKKQEDGINYLYGNAHNMNFLNEILRDYYDVIIDFMSYETKEFEERYNLLLKHTKQYIYLSSCRVYADSNNLISEDNLRLLDVCKNNEYLHTDEYALAKARQEDMLINAKNNNYTIVRPYITYNTYRLQLGMYEKEAWLSRVLNEKTIFFPKEMADKYTTFTYGEDVAKYIKELINNKDALGQVYNVTGNNYIKWRDLISLYEKILKTNFNKTLKIKYIDDMSFLKGFIDKWQIEYDRLYNRKIDNKKIKRICGEEEITSLEKGLEKCIVEFVKNPEWKSVDWKYQAICDKKAKERISILNITGYKNKLRYVKWRYLK